MNLRFVALDEARLHVPLEFGQTGVMQSFA